MNDCHVSINNHCKLLCVKHYWPFTVSYWQQSYHVFTVTDIYRNIIAVFVVILYCVAFLNDY